MNEGGHSPPQFQENNTMDSNFQLIIYERFGIHKPFGSSYDERVGLDL